MKKKEKSTIDEVNFFFLRSFHHTYPQYFGRLTLFEQVMRYDWGVGGAVCGGKVKEMQPPI